MCIEFDEKFIRNIKIIAISLTVLSVICLGIGAYYNYKLTKNYVEMPITDDSNFTIIEWLADYENDIAVQEKWRKDVKEIEVRLEKLGVEFDEVNGGK